ncbi:MAG TPA: hypothetical protein VFP64_07280 [Pyrinomonadaceae bacterium]|nr:hypothetical protein [Pyrinomonadaceae bacterium]
MTVSPHLSFAPAIVARQVSNSGNVRTSLEELSHVKIKMVLKCYCGLLPELPDTQASL